MYLRYIAYSLSVQFILSRCRKTGEVIANRMIAIDDKVNSFFLNHFIA